MHRTLLFAIVVLLLIRPPNAAAGDELSESIRVDWDPSGAISVRATTLVRDVLRIAVAGRSENGNQRIRLGIATPMLAIGPLEASGAYRELHGSQGGPRSDTWYAPSRITLDPSLDSSRQGLSFGPRPMIDLFLWKSSDVVLGTRFGLGDRDAFAEVLGTVTSPANVRANDLDATPSWFEDREETLPIGNVTVRLGGRGAGATLGTSVSGSFPRSALPGLSLRGNAKLSLPWRWMVAAGAFIATPDYRLQSGGRPDDAAQWGASLRRDGRFLDVGLDVDRAYASGDAAYEAVGFATEALSVSNTEATASIGVRRRDESRLIASVAAKVTLDLPPTGEVASRVRLSSRVAPRGWMLEVSPSVALSSEAEVSARARAVYSVPAPRILRLGAQSTLAVIVVGEYERDPIASDFDLSISIRTTIERTGGEAVRSRG